MIDAATLLHLVAHAVTVDPAHSLVAPHAIRSSALTLLPQAVGRGELTEAEALAQHEALTVVRIRLLGDRVSRRTAWRIAREQGWDDPYVAEHLAVTRLQADALVMVDAVVAESATGLVPWPAQRRSTPRARRRICVWSREGRRALIAQPTVAGVSSLSVCQSRS